jgi:putative SOS response-associated peptidase YedK
MIMVSVVLHNFLIKENEPDWIDNNPDDVSDIVAGDPQDDLLFSAVPANVNNDLRRKQLLRLRHIIDRI